MVTSNAAVVSLTAPSKVLQSDNLLNFIVNLLPALQIKLSTKGKSVSLSILDGTKTLTERNAILRSLCGTILLNRLDKYPFCLLGGYSEAVKSSSEAAMVIASISSYMSIAAMVRSGDKKEERIVNELNEVLQDNAFLIGATCKPTLADYDLFYALSEKNCLSAEVVTKDMIHLRRWIVAVQASISELVAVNGPSSLKGVPEVDVPTLEFGISECVPVFFYEEDDAGAGADTPASASAGSSGPAAPAEGKAAAASADADAGANSAKKMPTEAEKKAAIEKRAKKAAEKAKKKPKEKHGGGGATPAAELNVTALDIRVGKIIEVWEHDSSDKLWCEKIDLGESEPRQVLSGLRAFYKKEEMEGKHVLVLYNLKKRNLAGVPSHGMVLCATNADHTAVEFVIPPEGAKIGERVNFEGLTGDPEPENKLAKKKMLEKLAPDLKTNGDGVVVWKGIKSVTSAGPCVASKGMKDAQVS